VGLPAYLLAGRKKKSRKNPLFINIKIVCKVNKNLMQFFAPESIGKI